MSNFDHLPDDATRLSASLRPHFSGVSGHPTLVGWIARSVAVILLLGAGTVIGGLLGPVIYALLH